MTWEPGEFEELGSELRRRVGAELRDEAEEVERLTDLHRRRRNSLREVARAAMHRGDSVRIFTSERSWKGTLQTVGEDYLALEVGSMLVECPLETTALRTERSRAGGHTGKPASATWRARLAQLAHEQTWVHVLLRGSEEVVGRIEVVATDHLEIATEYPTYIPLTLVEAITSIP